MQCPLAGPQAQRKLLGLPAGEEEAGPAGGKGESGEGVEGEAAVPQKPAEEGWHSYYASSEDEEEDSVP